MNRPLKDLRELSPLLGWKHPHFTGQITGFPANFSNRQSGKSTNVSAEKCHWLYFVVVAESLRIIGNGRNTVPRVLFQKRELTEFCSKISEFCEKLGEFALAGQ